MASRLASSSLRRRFLWTIAVVGLIALVSVATIVFQRAPDDPQRAPVLAVAGEQPAAVQAHADRAPADQPPGPKPAGDYFSPRFGFGVELAGTPWKRWENLADLVPEADWGALLEQRGRLLVIPLLLGDLQPRQEALDHALLARLGVAYPSDALVDFRTIEHQRATGRAFRFVREVSGLENVYHVWVLRGKGCAYLAAAWLERVSGASDAEEGLLDEALERLSFDESPPSFEPAQLGPQQRQAHGVMYNDLGQFALAARDYAGSIPFFEGAIELRPDDPAVLSNLVSAHVEQKQYAQALAQLDRHLPRFENQRDLEAGRAFLLAEVGKTDHALAAYTALFSRGYQEEGPFTQYLTLLARHDRTSEALAAAEKFLQAKESFAVRRMQAGLLRQRGDHQRAIEILTALQEGRPFSAELAYDLADSLCSAQRYPSALVICRQLAEQHYDTAHMYVLQARSQYGLKWYAEAKKSLDAALAREPANEQAQELLALVGAMLGEGNNASVSEPIEPVRMPEALTASAAAAVVEEAQLQQYGAYLLRRHVALEFEPQKQFKLTDRRTIHLTDASAVARFSTIQIPFDPVSEQLYVNSLRVLDPVGNEVAATKISDYYVIDGSRGSVATHAKTLNIPVPALQAGYTIDLVLTRRDLAPSARFPYTAHLLGSDIPVLSALIYVRADEEAVQFKASPGVRMERAGGGLAWRVDDPPIYRDEPLGEAREAFLPRVALVDRTARWDRLVADYLDSIADRLQPDEAAQALARQLTAGAADREARIAAMMRYVQDSLTYKPIEFGRRARVPNRAPEILRNKYGDCKDHALLLVQLLRGCDVEAKLVLASLDAPVDPDLPALEQFDHMLVNIPGEGDGRFVDCTDKDSDLPSLEVPLDLGASRVLILDQPKARFVELPGYGPASSRIRVARQVKLINETDAAVEETVIIEGHHAAFLRNMFKAAPAANRAAMLQEELSPYADAMQMRSLEIENLAQRGKPLVFKAVYVVPNRFHMTGDRAVGQLPALWERMYLGVQPVADRRTPFEIEYPLEFSSTIQLTVPDHYQLETAQPGGSQSQSSFAAWKIETSSTKTGLQISYELHLPAGRYPASDYAGYHDELERAVAVLGQQVVLKRRP